jgi:hypothetical protein
VNFSIDAALVRCHDGQWKQFPNSGMLFDGEFMMWDIGTSPEGQLIAAGCGGAYIYDGTSWNVMPDLVYEESGFTRFNMLCCAMKMAAGWNGEI